MTVGVGEMLGTVELQNLGRGPLMSLGFFSVYNISLLKYLLCRLN